MAPGRIVRLLFIVARRRGPFYESLRRTFGGDDTVQVVLDRRVAERRRKRPARRKEDRRQADRRAQRQIDRQIRSRGYAVVGVRVFQRPPGAAPGPPGRKAR